MQNVDGVEGSESLKDVKTIEVGQAILTPPSSGSPVMEKDRVLAALNQQNFMDLSGSDEGEASEVESFILEQEDIEDGEPVLDTSRFLLSPDNIEGTDLRNVDPETQARLEALLEAAGIGKLSTADGKAFADPEVLRRLTSSVSCALDEAAAALTRMRAEQQGQLPQGESNRSLAEACSDGDIGTVRKLLDEGRSVHETTEEGESLLSLACSAGYYELAQVLLAMRANVEDRGIKGDCTPLMEAASGGYVDIVKLLIAHEADVNAQSSAGNTPLHYAACGGYQDVVRVLIEAGANVEEHNENGHTPLMEAASAGHVSVAKILLEAGAGINTHSNEFKESALTLACYKGHLDMVKFLLEAGADQEHKTDEMHTALMEASMDGHVEVARLLLDSGAQVNMPADSFESPLTLAACGGHVELANLLIERGANLEEVNDEGYTPLMEAAREGHEEMVALLLAHGADINAQTEETQETALTLACCGGFLEVADFLIKAGADIELGCSTPLMEAAQEGHLDLVKYLLKQGANVHAQTGTGDTALTYACENGHTDVADVLLQQRADLEHESEGGRTPLMKAARAGHLCTVQFLISKGADVNRQTTNNDHTVLSLACAGGHLAVVELLLAHGGDPTHKLKDGSTMLIEGAKGGHTQVVNLLLDYPNSILSPSPDINQFATPDSSVHMNELPRVPMQGLNNIVPPQDPDQIPSSSANRFDQSIAEVPGQAAIPKKTPDQVRQNMQKAVSRSAPTVKQKPKDRAGDTRRPGDIPGAAEQEPDYNEDFENNFIQDSTGATGVAATTTGAASGSAGPNNNNNSSQTTAFDFEIKADMKTSEKCEKLEAFIKNMMRKADMLNTTREEQIVKKQQILEELKKVERELQEKAEAQQLLSTQQQLGRGDATPGAGFSQQVEATKSADKTNNSSEAEAVAVAAAAAAAAETQAGVDMEGVANGLTVIDQLIDSIVIDLDVPFNFGQASGRGGSDADNASSVNEKLARLLAKQESTGSLDSTTPANVTTENSGNVEVDGVGGAGDPGITRAGDGEESATTPKEDQPAPMPPQPTPPQEQPQLPQDTQLDVDIEHNEEVDDEDEEDEDEDEGCGEEEDDDNSYHEEDEDIEEEYIEGDEDDLDEDDDDEDDEDEEDDILGSAYMGEEHSSRASSEEVDLTNVVPATEKQMMLQQVEQTRQQQQQHTQDQLAVARAMLDNPAAALALAGQIMPVPGLDQETLQQLQTLPLHTVLEQSVAAATSTAAALDQQHQQLQQQRQQLQAQLALQQQLQVELQQQLKLQQEHQQLQQQLKAQQALTQQMEIQQLTNKPKFQAQFQNQAGGKVQQPGTVATTTPQPVVNLQQLQAHLAKVQPQLLTSASQQLPLTLPQQKQQQVAAAAAQQVAQLKGQQQQQQQQQQPAEPQADQPPVVAVQGQLDARHQQELQQQLTQVSRQVQQLQASQQLTQQELLAQAQQLQQQLQQAQQLQQLAQQKQVTQHLTQQDLLHQAQQLQQQLQQAQHLQQLAQQQKQFSHIQGAQKKSKKKPHPAPVTDQSSLVLPPPNQNQTYTTPVTSLPGTIQESVTPPSSTPLTPNPSPASPQYCAPVFPAVDLDAQTESNHDTALTLACAGGHVELVSLLLSRGADIEHRDKKGFTPLILAATAGHADVVEMLLDHGADIEAQSERTKDTPLSLACSGGRYEVVELLLARGANKEHRNVSDYTPLSLAASGGYVNIIKLLLSHGAEINSRTGSKLGISPLMLAAMNGHTAAVKLLLDMGSDINAQIETNRNTALTLACFQGRHEVVSLLVDRKANIEHRAKTGLTPLMEAASGGYVEVGRVLLDKGADVNAPPVPSSRDTALTIAADKGHYRFVELLLSRSAAVDVKNKKGNSPLWLACNGGHLDVVQLLVNAKADIDSQDNRKVSCLIAAFRKGHVKVIKWMVKHVAQFPSDPECMRYISTITDKELLKKCHQCMEIIVSAKDRQAAEANRHASILLEQLDREKSLEESKKAAAARKREKRRRKKKEKQEQAKTEEPIPVSKPHKEDKSGNNKNSNSDASTREKQDDDDDESIEDDGEKSDTLIKPPSATTSTTTGIPPVTEANNKNQAHKRSRNLEVSSNSSSSSESNGKTKSKKSKKAERERDRQLEREAEEEKRYKQAEEEDPRVPDMRVPATPANNPLPNNFQHSNSILPSSHGRKKRQESSISNDRHGIGELDDFGVPSNITKGSSKEKERNKKNERASKVSTLRESFSLLSPGKGSGPKGSNVPSPKKNQKKEEGWKEVTRKSKKVTVPSNAISRVIGRGGSNINAIREVSGAHIDVDKQKGSGDRIVVIKGSAEATRQAHNLISSLIKDPDKDLDHLLPKQHQRNSSVYQNNNNNLATPSANSAPSLLPASSASSPAVTAGVTTCAAAPLTIPMTQIFSTSVWHNNMASHLSSSVSPVPSSLTASQAKAAVAASKAAAIAVSLAMTTSQLTAPFANVVRQSHSANSNRLTPSGAPMGAFQTGPIPSSSSPKRPSSSGDVPTSVLVSSGTTPGKSPSAVSRRLFQGEKCANATTVKTSVTYSTVSMAKTKVVTATSQTFASKVDSSGVSNRDGSGNRHNSNSKSQAMTSSVSSPTPGSGKSSQQGPATPKQPADPQPLPIKTSLSNTRLVSSQSVSRGSPLVSAAPSDYSPFNSRFSQLDMLGKKEEDRMNFASVAAAGVIPTTSSVIGSVSPAPLETHPDPNLPAKAPGYKAPNQRTSSPHVVDSGLSAAVADAQQRHTSSAPGGLPQAIDVAVLESQMKALAHTQAAMAGGFPPHPHHHNHHASNHQTLPHEADPSKAPGYKGGFVGDYSEHRSSSHMGGFRHQLHSGLSPRPSHFSFNSGPFSLLSQHATRDEYSTPDQPMTLPKIESTLNPNAPDFTSRSYEPSGRFSHMSGLNMGPGFVPGYGSIGGLAGMSGVAPPTMGPAGMHTGSGGGGFRVQPPSGGVLNQQNVTPLMSNSELLSQGNDLSSTNNGQVLPHMANAGYMSSGAMTVQSSMARQFKNMPPSGPSSSTTPPIGASSKGESPIPAEPSPASSSAPSPTDHPGLVSSDAMPRPLRPIGTERAYKKPQVSGFSIPEAGAAGLWSFNSDLGPEWMSTMTSAMTSGVMTSGVMTSGVMTPGLSAEGEDHVGPPSMPPPMMTGPFPTPDSHMDPSVELAFGPAAVVFANGVPAGAAAALPLAHMYTQAPMTVDRLPSMWGHPVKGHPDPVPQDPKLVRPHFSH